MNSSLQHSLNILEPPITNILPFILFSHQVNESLNVSNFFISIVSSIWWFLVIIIFILFFLSGVKAASFSLDHDVSGIYLFQNSRVIYKNNVLFVQGLIGHGTVEVYSIIGNKISDQKVVDLSNAQIPLYLESGNMYIVRVRYQGNVMKTFKILAN